MSRNGARRTASITEAGSRNESDSDEKVASLGKADYFFFYNTPRNTFEGEESGTEVDGMDADELTEKAMASEVDRNGMEEENELLRAKTARQRSKLMSAKRRIELLEFALSKLSQPLEEVQAQKERKCLECTEQHAKIAELEEKVEELQLDYEETELARKNAMYKMKELRHQVAVNEEKAALRDGNESFSAGKGDPHEATDLNDLRHPEMVPASNLNRVHYVAGEASTTDGSDGRDSSIQKLEEVVVRLQVEMMRTRRMDSLRRLISIRHVIDQRSIYQALIQWKFQPTEHTQTSESGIHRIIRMLQCRYQRRLHHRFQLWRSNAKLVQAHREQRIASDNWNRKLGAERLANILWTKMTVSKVVRFHQWHAVIDTKASQEDMQPLKEEIRKLYEQLHTANSEAWDYKRQVLKQFLK
uniref:AlNc14C94G5807 protein n=1 Tax=Albugo laibachii Nc14 TaxID=890382 RepID=F0WGT0_9STRA|nr:AlNc14C94G5807 [Albugo laibachii Nc14]|eukprot:CCA20444.1 AlNc14C94G5807 [Albugo laibachii Nc14]